jgi:5-methylcytosine-specific restriction endonuclease McrA
MRPVTHPPQPAANVYPTFRVTSETDLEADLMAYQWNSTSPIPLEYFDLAQSLDGWDALRWVLLEFILNPPPPRPKPSKQPKKKARKEVTISDVKHYAELFRNAVYAKARTPLIAALGRYCSYCEQSVSETIAVEHVAPKANYPLTAVSWSNFLLCCRSCNSYKDEKPDRNVAWLPNGDEIALYNAIRNRYLLADTSAGAYWSLLPVLHADTGGGFQPVDDAVSVSDALARIRKGDEFTKLPRAQVPFTAGAQPANVRVYMVPTANVAYLGGRAQAQETFDQCRFGEDGVGSSDDNRMWDRTNKWLDAVDEFRKLAATADFPNQWSTVCRLAGESGFLSTWVRVLQLRGGGALPYPPPPAVQTSTLLAQFLHQMSQVQDAPYPATDLTRLP